MKKNSEYFLLFIILIVGSWVRFHNLGDISYSNDELSALTRARVETFHDLVEKGIKVDGHPALVQTMIWFTIHHFSDSPFTVRFPFAVAGIISIFLLFLLAKKWFGMATGLLSAAAIATLQFPVLYSQVARPYAIGLMFSLALAYFWTRLVFDEKKKSYVIIAYILASAGCIYTHYFSFMLAGITGISGLFFLKKKNIVPYVIYNCIPLLLFIPSISIFRQQFGYEGIGGWLPPPDGKFLERFIFYIFNESWLVTIVLILTLILSAIFNFRKSGWTKFHSLSLIWFFVPFLIGYVYSIIKAPVLQYSTLLFSFPFLIIFVFSFINEEWSTKKILMISVFIMLAMGTYSTVFENKYFKTNHFGVFKELAEKTKQWDEKYGNNNIIKLFSLSNPEYINYYFRRLEHDPHISIYTDDEQTKYGVLNSLLDTSTAEYFAYAWTNAVHFYETPALIQEKYPVIAERDTFFNSEITLFKKGTASNDDVSISESDLESNSWGYETDRQNDEVAHSGLYSQKMDEKMEYSISYSTEITNLHLSKQELIKAEVWFYFTDTIKDATLVISFLKKGEMYSYKYTFLRNFESGKNKWQKAILFSELPDEECEMRIYVWNPKGETFYIDDFSVKRIQRSNLYRP